MSRRFTSRVKWVQHDNTEWNRKGSSSKSVNLGCLRKILSHLGSTDRRYVHHNVGNIIILLLIHLRVRHVIESRCALHATPDTESKNQR